MSIYLLRIRNHHEQGLDHALRFGQLQTVKGFANYILQVLLSLIPDIVAVGEAGIEGHAKLLEQIVWRLTNGGAHLFKFKL